jgi:hypothetical protein
VDAAESSVFALNVDRDIIVGQSGDEFSDLFALATKVFEQSPRNAERFAVSRKREIEGLLEGNGFATMRRDSAIANGDRIYKSRFVDAVKNHGTPKELPKSTFVLCGYNDNEAKSLLTKAPTMSKNSTRVLLALAASCPGLAVRLRDISQAYTQSRT